MRFPNAYSGVKKIFSAEILKLIGGVVLIVSTLVTLFAVVLGKAALNEADQALQESLEVGAISTLIPSLIGIFAAVVLVLIAFIFNIIGVTRASNDEASFRIALFGIIAGIIFAMTGSAFAGINGSIKSLMDTLSTISDLVVLVYVIQGIRNLAVNLGNSEMDEKGNNIFKIILVVVVLRFIANIIVMIFGGITSASVVAIVFTIVAAVLSVVQYIMYLVYLAKARKMLAE